MTDTASGASRRWLVRALSVAGGVVVAGGAVILLRLAGPAVLGWLQWLVVVAAVLVLILLGRSAWGLWIYFLQVPPIHPPAGPAQPFGASRARARDVTCPGCRGRVPRATLAADGALHCPDCSETIQVLRPA